MGREVVAGACNYAAGDFNLNNEVDGFDLATMLAWWGIPNAPVGDIDGDGVVGNPDLSIILARWGPLQP